MPPRPQNPPNPRARRRRRYRRIFGLHNLPRRYRIPLKLTLLIIAFLLFITTYVAFMRTLKAFVDAFAVSKNLQIERDVEGRVQGGLERLFREGRGRREDALDW